MVLRRFALAAALLLSLLGSNLYVFAQERTPEYSGVVYVISETTVCWNPSPEGFVVWTEFTFGTELPVFAAQPWDGYIMVDAEPPYGTSCLVEPAAVDSEQPAPPVEGTPEATPEATPVIPVATPVMATPVEEGCSEGCEGEPIEVFLGDITINADGAACQVWPSWESEIFTSLSSGVTVSQIADGKGDGWQKVRLYLFEEPADCYVRQEYLGNAAEDSEGEKPAPVTVSTGSSGGSTGTAPTAPPVVKALPSTGSGPARDMLSEMLGEAALYAFAAMVCLVAACWAGYKEYNDEIRAWACRIWRPLAKAFAWTLEAMWLWPLAFGLLGADAIRAGNAWLRSRRIARRRQHARYALSYSQ